MDSSTVIQFVDSLDIYDPQVFKNYSVCRGLFDTYTIVGKNVEKTHLTKDEVIEFFISMELRR